MTATPVRIAVDTHDGLTVVVAPGNPDLATGMRRIKGRWDRDTRTWTVDARDETRVRALLRKIYGTDGNPDDMADVVTVRWKVPGAGQHVHFGGRCIASRWNRDEPVRLADGVVVVDGNFPGSGGSMKNPAVIGSFGWPTVTVEIRDIPRVMLSVEDDDSYELVPEPFPTVDAETITVRDALTRQLADEADADVLRAEREKLAARIAEIDARLAKLR